VTDVNADLVNELVESGLDRREARWLVEEFAPGRSESTPALTGAAERRRGGEPLQYVLGHWPFRSLDLLVDERALIPRPETEELVGVALAELARGDVAWPLIVDLGCGTGALGLSILDELRSVGVVATLIALDDSEDALVLARENARRHDLLNVSFVHSSWFDGLDESLRGRVDLVVANPPYVGALEFEQLDPVLRFEPRGAIVAADVNGVEGFADLEVIVRESYGWLRPGGALICEHASAHRSPVTTLARATGFVSVVDLDDLAGLPRIMVASR
jgi:release factor glutamine methyltransferase